MSNPDAQARAGWPRALRRHIESLTQKPTFLTAQSQAAATASRRAFLRNISGGTPKVRRNARRMRSRSTKPVSCATTLTVCLPSSIMNLAASSRSRSTAFAGDWPVSPRKARLNWRGLRLATAASS